MSENLLASLSLPVDLSRMDIISFAIDAGLNVSDTIVTYSQVLANWDAYIESLDILYYASTNADTLMVRLASEKICTMFTDEYHGFSSAVNES